MFPIEPLKQMKNNLLIILSFIGLFTIIGLLLYVDNVNETIIGFAISVGTMFASGIGTAIDYEFGSSAGSKIKDQIINEKKL